VNLDQPPIAFIDLAAQQRRLGHRIDDAIQRVLAHGGYIMGPEVKQFEAQLVAFCGAGHVVSCANGTEAIAMVLLAWQVGPGDAVLVPSFTFAATAEAVVWTGATPVFVDVLAATYNMDALSLQHGIARAQALGLRPRVVMPVDLFGQPADYAAIEKIAVQHDLLILCDAAQSFGARYGHRAVGQIGHATTTSFFPAKPLGCYGDGGAILTDDADLAGVLRSLRMHGQGTDKYDNIRVGMNARLDTLQAAILIEKLAIFPDEIVARAAVAARYDQALAGTVAIPQLIEGATSVWAQYTVQVDPDKRAAIAAALASAGVPTAIYYPKPLHRQSAYQRFPSSGNGLPVSDHVSTAVLSLPMHPYLDTTTQDRIIAAVIAATAMV
jgi:dTDP-4-amino-4,6-dideoxygalactose transaminase